MSHTLPTCLLALLIAAAPACTGDGDSTGCPSCDLPSGDGSTTRLDQGWSDAEREAWYAGSFGGALLPSAWMHALEAPAGGVRMTDALLALELAPDPDAPFGIAGLIEVDTATGPAAALNCAFCHTELLRFNGHVVQIDGGAGMADVSSFQGLMFASVIATAKDPARLDRFAAEVLGDAAAIPEARAQLDAVVMMVSAGFELQIQTAEALDLLPLTPGFGRIDAQNAISNVLFGVLNPANLFPIDAPVSTPSLWGTTAMEWVHYNAGSNQRIHRNASQGTVADLQFTLAKPDTFASRIDVRGTHALDAAVRTLRAPAWPERILGAIDDAAAERGGELYASLCASCHEPSFDGDVMKVTEIDIDEVGTDRKYIDRFNDRVFDLSAIGLGSELATQEAYTEVLARILDRAYELQEVGPEERTEIEDVDGDDAVWRTTEVIKANPLAGIWASPPYLHNGSVASLYELLLPASDRTPRLLVGGGRDYDPDNVGYSLDQTPAAFELDTSIDGNHNTGHEYGVDIGDTDKRDLIEYLKTL